MHKKQVRTSVVSATAIWAVVVALRKTGRCVMDALQLLCVATASALAVVVAWQGTGWDGTLHAHHRLTPFRWRSARRSAHLHIREEEASKSLLSTAARSAASCPALRIMECGNSSAHGVSCIHSASPPEDAPDAPPSSRTAPVVLSHMDASPGAASASPVEGLASPVDGKAARDVPPSPGAMGVLVILRTNWAKRALASVSEVVEPGRTASSKR